tara:strand:+ start:148 stop:540 length:393 start_codon:yes stop_codon:yes gene_type:complete
MNQNDLELKISGLEKAIQEHKADADRYQDELKTTQKQLADINKIALPPMVFDEIQEAIDKAIEEFDFSDDDNFETEFEMDYDNKVRLSNLDFRNSYDLVELIAGKVADLFSEAECPEELDTTEDDNHPVV